MRTLVIACFAAWPMSALAQQQACSSPGFEARLIAAVAKGEVQLKSIPAGKAQDYARCYARESCAKLGKIEFEMYALSQITSYAADDRAEKEYIGRMRQHRKENNAALDKISSKALEDACKREVGLK